MAVVGGGYIGVELGTAFAKLGSQVTVIEMERLLAKDDPDLADVVRRQLLGDGMALLEGARAMAISGGAMLYFFKQKKWL